MSVPSVLKRTGERTVRRPEPSRSQGPPKRHRAIATGGISGTVSTGFAISQSARAGSDHITRQKSAPSPGDWEERLRRLLSWAAVVAVICYGVLLFALFLIGGSREPRITELVIKHYATVEGLPSAAAAALFIVLVLKAAAGPIEFEAIGFKFRGASGPVVLWVLCFLSIVVGIRAIWGLEA